MGPVQTLEHEVKPQPAFDINSVMPDDPGPQPLPQEAIPTAPPQVDHNAALAQQMAGQPEQPPQLPPVGIPQEIMVADGLDGGPAYRNAVQSMDKEMKQTSVPANLPPPPAPKIQTMAAWVGQRTALTMASSLPLRRRLFQRNCWCSWRRAAGW